MSNRIYLDNAATTPLLPAVIAAMHDTMQQVFGNPSSIHAEGRQARTLVEQARRSVAHSIKASIGEVFFTSCGTESNNTALQCAVRDLGIRRIISSATEHHCVLHTLEDIAKNTAATIAYLPLSANGTPDLAVLAQWLEAAPDMPTLVSLMWANNETGAMLDLQHAAELCQQHGALFHTDTVQTLGYFPIDLSQTPISFLSGSAHKFHGPKGTGFLYINANNLIRPFLHGGAQERNMRAGTENLYGIVGMAKALELAYAELPDREAHIRALRSHFLQRLGAELPFIQVNGQREGGHYKILNLRIPASPKSDLLLFNLDIEGISVSGGSACSSGSDAGSHVMRAMYGQEDDAVNIRVSMSHLNTLEEMDVLMDTLKKKLL